MHGEGAGEVPRLGSPASEGAEISVAALLGWWKIESDDVEFQSDGRREPMFGTAPRGYLVFTAERRMMVYVEAQDRIAPATEAECARAYRSMCAYSGMFEIEGSRWITSVDVAWNGAWAGTRQMRRFFFDDERLHVISDWYSSPLHEGRVARAHLVWRRDSRRSPHVPAF